MSSGPSAGSGGICPPWATASSSICASVTTMRTEVSTTASRATSSHSASRVTSATGSQSSSSVRTSRSLSIGLTGTAMAPSRQAASTATTNAGTFCRYRATRSPRATPRCASAAAKAPERSSSAAKVSALSR